MRKNYENDAARIAKALSDFEDKFGVLPGITATSFRESLIEQIIDSEQRVLYFRRLSTRSLDPASVDPNGSSFDPIKAALIYRDQGNTDEAAWLIFLFVHFGKHRQSGWQYLQRVYGQNGNGKKWTWDATAGDPISFRFWLNENIEAIKAGAGRRGFGNHRKYESLNAWGTNGTGEAVQSYVEWVLGAGGDHAERFAETQILSPSEGFDRLYKSMSSVARFGRVARFDYLTTLMKTDLLQISPPHSYIRNATGPLAGARLLLRGNANQGTGQELEEELQCVSESTGISPDILEDAICNWQKSPEHYKKFSG